MICQHLTEPTFESECHEAIYSQGASCQKCKASCYRQGWGKGDVTADNLALVLINHSKVLTMSHIAEMKRARSVEGKR